MTARAAKPEDKAVPLDRRRSGARPPPVADRRERPRMAGHLRKKIRESLDDPRPSIPAKEAFARVDARIAEYKAKHGL